MTGPVVLHQYAVSPFGEKVRRLLNAKGIAHEVRDVTLVQSVRLAARLSPAGRLPVLDIGGERIYDSTEIAYALEALHPHPSLIPSDPLERAQCHVLEDWADESLYFYEMTVRFLWPADAARWARATAVGDPRWARRVAPVFVPRALARRARPQGVGAKPKPLVLREVRRHVEALDALLAGRDWLVGSGLSLADIAVAAQITAIDGSRECSVVISDSAGVRAWLARTDALTLGHDSPLNL